MEVRGKVDLSQAAGNESKGKEKRIAIWRIMLPLGIIAVASAVVGIIKFARPAWYAMSSLLFFLSIIEIYTVLSIRIENELSNKRMERLDYMCLRDGIYFGIFCWIIAEFLYLVAPIIGTIMNENTVDAVHLIRMIAFLLFAAAVAGLIIKVAAKIIGRD